MEIFTPKTVYDRYRKTIYLFQRINDKFLLIVNSNIQVTLVLAEDINNPETIIEFKQDFNSPYPTVKENLAIHFYSTEENEPIEITELFKENLKPLEVFNSLKLKVEERKNEIYKRKFHLSTVKKERENNIPGELTIDQKRALVYYLCKFTWGTPEHVDKYCRMYDLESFHYLYTELNQAENHYKTLLLLRNKYAINRFILYCLVSDNFLKDIYHIKEFVNILTEWGFTREDIDNEFANKSKCYITKKEIIYPIEEFKLKLKRILRIDGINIK